MKIRSGFVSNSSTSSFVLASWCVTDLEAFLESKKEKVVEIISICLSDMLTENEIESLKNVFTVSENGILHGEDDPYYDGGDEPTFDSIKEIRDLNLSKYEGIDPTTIKVTYTEVDPRKPHTTKGAVIVCLDSTAYDN
jgi:hypothetical protein